MSAFRLRAGLATTPPVRAAVGRRDAKIAGRQSGYDSRLAGMPPAIDPIEFWRFLVFDIAILGQVALGYCPFIDRDRTVTATRLTAIPLIPASRLDAAEFLEVVRGVWPADGGRVSLNVVSESLLHDLLDAKPASNIMIEVPAFMAGDEANTEAIRRLHDNGNELLIKGRPVRELPRDVLPCFRYAIIDLSEDRRINSGQSAPAGVKRTIAHVQSGVRSRDQMEGSFSRGAAAVLGWPIDDAIDTPAEAAAMPQTDMAVIVELIGQVDAKAPVEQLEATLRRDPTLAFRLLRYINAPPFGLQVEIGSFRHAIMMLGYERLKRWLALLLATASREAGVKPLMFAAVRRGLLMEELARGSGDEVMRSEMFICGIFSLLDRMLQQPFADLLQTIPVSDRVQRALNDNAGPYQPYLALVNAIEAGTLEDFRQAANHSMLGVAEINRALLTALAVAERVR